MTYHDISKSDIYDVISMGLFEIELRWSDICFRWASFINIEASIKVEACACNYIHVKYLNVIAHACPISNTIEPNHHLS